MNIVFIGGGKMAEAIIAGLLESGVCAATDVTVCEIDVARRDTMASTYGIHAAEHISEAPGAADVVFLAVKPQVMDVALGAAVSAIPAAALVISIAAGKSLAQIEAPFECVKAVRVMPNLAASVGSSMNAFCANAHVNEHERTTVKTLLAAFGEVVEADESLFDAVTAVSGSGPAYVAYLIDALAAAGAAQGLSESQAYTLALQTFLGTAEVLRASGTSPDDLIASVSSPNGTTVAGMDVLRASSARDVMSQTVAAAAQRSKELREG